MPELEKKRKLGASDSLETERTPPLAPQNSNQSTMKEIISDELSVIELQEPAFSFAVTRDMKLVAVANKSGIHIFNAITNQLVDSIPKHLRQSAEVSFAACIGIIRIYLLAVWDCDRPEPTSLYDIDSSGKVLDAVGGSWVDSNKLVASIVSQLVSDHSWVEDERSTQFFAQRGKDALNDAVSLRKSEHQITLDGNMVRFSPDASFLISAPFGQSDLERWKQHVVVWDIGHRSIRYTFPSANDGVDWVEVSPDSNLIAYMGRDGILEFWNPNDGNRENAIGFEKGTFIWDAVFSPDSKHIALTTETNDKKSIDVYTVATGAKVSSFRGCGRYPSMGSCNWGGEGQLETSTRIRQSGMINTAHIRFDNDGKKLVFSTNRGKVYLYDATSIAPPKLFHRLKPNNFNDTVWSSDGSWFVVLENNRTLRFWAPKWGTITP
ncbi:hypothetical protein BJX99DRAFT_262467 [Aspergillus californicus]